MTQRNLAAGLLHLVPQDVDLLIEWQLARTGQSLEVARRNLSAGQIHPLQVELAELRNRAFELTTIELPQLGDLLEQMPKQGFQPREREGLSRPGGSDSSRVDPLQQRSFGDFADLLPQLGVLLPLQQSFGLGVPGRETGFEVVDRCHCRPAELGECLAEWRDDTDGLGRIGNGRHCGQERMLDIELQPADQRLKVLQSVGKLLFQLVGEGLDPGGFVDARQHRAVARREVARSAVGVPLLECPNEVPVSLLPGPELAKRLRAEVAGLVEYLRPLATFGKQGEDFQPGGEVLRLRSGKYILEYPASRTIRPAKHAEEPLSILCVIVASRGHINLPRILDNDPFELLLSSDDRAGRLAELSHRRTMIEPRRVGQRGDVALRNGQQSPNRSQQAMHGIQRLRHIVIQPSSQRSPGVENVS